MPVLPLVGSMMVVARVSRPLASASWIMLKPIRSFTLPPGLKDSSFTTTRASPGCSPGRRRRSRGVLPISSVRLS